MKKTIKKHIHRLPELDTLVEELLTKAKQHALLNAEHYALRNLPPLQAASFGTYVQEDVLKFQEIVDTAAEKLQPKAICNEVLEDKQQTGAKLQKLQNNLMEQKEKLITIMAKLNGKIQPYNQYLVPLVWVTIGVVLLADAIFSTPFFETAGLNLLEALAMGMVLAVLLALASFFYEPIVRKGKTALQQWLIALILLLLLTGFFLLIAQARAHYLEQQIYSSTDGTIRGQYSPWPFVSCSMFAFVIAVSIHHFLFPDKAQRTAMREYKALLKEKQACEALQQQITDEIDAVKQQSTALHQTNVSIFEYGLMMEQRIISAAEGCIAAWKKLNTMHRPDNGRPVSFDNEHYVITWKLYFHFPPKTNQ